MDGEEVAHLRLECRWHALAQDVDRVAQRRSRRLVERVDLLGRQARSLAERQQARGVHDLVAVGVADPGHERLVPEQVLELARVSLDAVAPALEGERRVVRVRTLLVAPEARDRSIDAGRLQVDLAHLGGIAVAHLDVRFVRGEPRGASGPGRGIDRPVLARPEPQDDGRLRRQLRAGRGELETARQHRVDHERVPVEVDEEELPAAPDRADSLADERLRARPACLARPAARGPPRTGSGGRRAPRGRPRRRPSGLAIRARSADCSREKACARLSRPRGQDS